LDVRSLAVNLYRSVGFSDTERRVRLTLQS